MKKKPYCLYRCFSSTFSTARTFAIGHRSIIIPLPENWSLKSFFSASPFTHFRCPYHHRLNYFLDSTTSTINNTLRFYASVSICVHIIIQSLPKAEDASLAVCDRNRLWRLHGTQLSFLTFLMLLKVQVDQISCTVRCCRRVGGGWRELSTWLKPFDSTNL